MSYILLYQINKEIGSRSYLASTNLEDVMSHLVLLYNRMFEKEDSFINFIELDDFLTYYYSIFDLMLMYSDNDTDFITYGRDDVAEMFINYIEYQKSK